MVQQKLYKTVMADPPWDVDQRGRRGASSHDSMLSVEKIKYMPVADLMEDNDHCYLWLTNGSADEKNLIRFIDRRRDLRIYDSAGLAKMLIAKADGLNAVGRLQIKSATKRGFLEAAPGDSVSLGFANMMELFQRHGVEFVSSTERFDTSTPMERTMLNICIVFAQLERETIQRHVADAYHSRTRKGFRMGKIPYGYTSEPWTIQGISTTRLIAEPQTSFGDITGCSANAVLL